MGYVVNVLLFSPFYLVAITYPHTFVLIKQNAMNTPYHTQEIVKHILPCTKRVQNILGQIGYAYQILDEKTLLVQFNDDKEYIDLLKSLIG